MSRNYRKGYDSDRVEQAFQQSTGSKMYRRGNVEAFDATSSKMVKGPETDAAIRSDNLALMGASDTYVKSAMSRSIERIRDSQNTLQLLPDIKLSLEIIIGGILSPKDLVTTKLTYSCDNNALKDTAGPMIDLVENYFTSSYKLKDKLQDILWDVLGRTGSYPTAVLPETTVDYLINKDSRVTLESLTSTIYTTDGKIQHAGILPITSFKQEEQYNETSVFDLVKSFESADVSLESNKTLGSVSLGSNISVGDNDVDFKLTFTDNFDVLKLPTVARRASSQNQQSKINNRIQSLAKRSPKRNLGYGVESMTIINGDDIRTDKDKAELAKLYPKREFRGMSILKVKPRSLLEKQNFGHPLVLKLSTESVIPIHAPNDPSDHIDYLVVLDGNGVPLRLAEADSIYKSITTATNGTLGSNGAMGWALQYAANQMNGDLSSAANAQNALLAIDRATPIFKQTIENELLERISRGSLGSGIALGNNDHIWTLMLMRAFVGRNTQILYIPGSLVSYIAQDYDEFGLGKTILDDSKTLAALRALNMFTNAMASTKNAITRRTIGVALDPAEKNPQRALDIIHHEFAKGTRNEFPLSNSPVDMINYIQMAGLNIDVEEHPLLPNTKFDVSYVDNDYRKIETEWDEYLKDQHINATGLPAEVVSNAGKTDFQAQAIFNNVITGRRIKGLSERICVGISGFVRRYVYNSQILMDSLINEVVKSGKKYRNQFGELMTDEEVATQFLDTLNVSLPFGDLDRIKEQKESFEEISDFYKDALEHFISEDFFNEEELGRLGENGIEGTRKYLHSMYMRRWFRENGIMTELFELIAKREDGSPLIDVLSDKEQYLDTIGESILAMAKSRFRRKDKLDKEMDKLEKKYGEEETGGGSGDFGSGGDDNPPGGDDDFDGDDLGFGDDLGGDDTPADDESTGNGDSGGEEETPTDDVGDDDSGNED